MITAIIAVDEAGGMGLQGNLPWPKNKEDMRWFKLTTTGNIVVMGRKTWRSDMPTPLPNRINVVLSRQFYIPDADHVFSEMDTAITFCQSEYIDKEIYIIGGKDIIIQSKPYLDKIYLTRIPGNYNCDILLDVSNFLSGFKLNNKIDLGSCIVEEYINETIS